MSLSRSKRNPLTARWLWLAGFVLAAAAVAGAGSTFFGWPVCASEILAPGSMKPAGGAGVQTRLSAPSFFARVYEDGVALGPRTHRKGDVDEEGRGIFYLKGNQLRFSSSDETDPRFNGRVYRVNRAFAYAGPAVAGAILAAAMVLLIASGRNPGRLAGNALVALRRKVHGDFQRFGARMRASPDRTFPGAAKRFGWLAILAAPSIFLLIESPVFWRDSDGFWQLAGEPGVNTILHWPPLYNFGARLPLWLGAWVDALFWGGRFPASDFFAEPHFSDRSVWFLAATQHGCLLLALAAMIRTLTARPGWRVLLAILFASNSALYFFAQTLGSESLSNALTIGFLAACLSIHRDPDPKLQKWIVGALLLAGCILARHINAVLAGVLPCASLLVIFAGWVFPKRTPGDPRWSRFLRAFAMGVAAILLSNLTLRAVSFANGIETRSRIGYTFQWRLNFLPNLPESTRKTLLAGTAGRTADPLVASVIRSFDGAAKNGPPWDTGFANEQMTKEVGRLGIRTRGAREAEKDRRLNVLARAFLLHPTVLAITASDFLAGWAWTPSDIAREPLLTTNFLVDAKRQKRFASIAHLSALQSPITDADLGPVLTGYLDLWKWCPVWMIALAVVFLCAASLVRKGFSPSAIFRSAFCFSLLLTGSLMYFLNCALTFNAPRFLLPLDIMLMVALAHSLLSAFGDGDSKNPSLPARRDDS